MKIFDTFEEVEDMKDCIKKPIVVQCKQIHEVFNVNTLEGNYKIGKAGDYLIKGIDGELYICDGPIFEKTYDIINEDTEHTTYLSEEAFDSFVEACINPQPNKKLMELLENESILDIEE